MQRPFALFTVSYTSKTIAARVDDDLISELDQLARQTNRNRSALIEEALRSYVTSERNFLGKVHAGLADLAAGRVTDHQTVAGDSAHLSPWPVIQWTDEAKADGAGFTRWLHERNPYAAERVAEDVLVSI